MWEREVCWQREAWGWHSKDFGCLWHHCKNDWVTSTQFGCQRLRQPDKLQAPGQDWAKLRYPINHAPPEIRPGLKTLRASAKRPICDRRPASTSSAPVTIGWGVVWHTPACMVVGPAVITPTPPGVHLGFTDAKYRIVTSLVWTNSLKCPRTEEASGVKGTARDTISYPDSTIPLY